MFIYINFIYLHMSTLWDSSTNLACYTSVLCGWAWDLNLLTFLYTWIHNGIFATNNEYKPFHTIKNLNKNCSYINYLSTHEYTAGFLNTFCMLHLSTLWASLRFELNLSFILTYLYTCIHNGIFATNDEYKLFSTKY